MERTLELHLLEGVSDAGGAVAAPAVAAPARLQSVGPVPEGRHTPRVRAVCSGGLVRDDGGQVAEIGFVGAVGRVAAVAVAIYSRPHGGGGERRSGNEDE